MANISPRASRRLVAGYFAVLILFGILAWALTPDEAFQETAQTDIPVRLIPTR